MALYGHSIARVDPSLVRVVALVSTRRDLFVVQADRTVADEQRDIDRGVSHLTDPKDSYHVIVPGVRPYALAVDLAAYTGDPHAPVNWRDHQAFADLAVDVKAAAGELGVTPFSWGGDWPRPFDFDHYQRAPAPV